MMKPNVQIVAACGLFLLAMPSLARAQSLKIPTAVFAIAAAGDWATTAVGLAGGAREQNPLLKRFRRNPTSTVAAGALIDLAGVCLWNRAVGHHHPKLAVAGLYTAAAFRTYLAIHNLRTPNIISP
jgi:hypothetical protein